MQIMSTINQVTKDNGFVNGLTIFLLLALQRMAHFPKVKTYSYHCRLFNKPVKLVYTSEITRGFSLVEMFGFMPYYQSASGNLVFNLNKDSMVLDIGGFIGDSAVLFGLQGARVYSYEPQKKACRLLQINARVNGLSQVIISDKPITSDGRGVSIAQQAVVSDSFKINDISHGSIAPSDSLATVLSKVSSWDLVKIDTEGTEWELINQFIAKDSLLNKIRGLIIELHAPYIHKPIVKKFLQILHTKGFQTELQVKGELGMLWAKRK